VAQDVVVDRSQLPPAKRRCRSDQLLLEARECIAEKLADYLAALPVRVQRAVGALVRAVTRG
jgi:hypothetical protein